MTQLPDIDIFPISNKSLGLQELHDKAIEDAIASIEGDGYSRAFYLLASPEKGTWFFPAPNGALDSYAAASAISKLLEKYKDFEAYTFSAMCTRLTLIKKAGKDDAKVTASETIVLIVSQSRAGGMLDTSLVLSAPPGKRPRIEKRVDGDLASGEHIGAGINLFKGELGEVSDRGFGVVQ